MVATVTHLNVLHVGGYNSVEAPMIIAVAALVAIGMGFGAWAWGEGRRWSALLLWTLILAGEGYWVLTNADRELNICRKWFGYEGSTTADLFASAGDG